MKFTEVKFQEAATRTYLGSPSIIRLDSGDLLATHDYFGPGCALNHEAEEHLLSVCRSRDDGGSWHNLTHVAGQYWSTLFKHGGGLYLLGTSQQYGSIVIRRSEDGGNTWTHPADEKSGLLFRGGPFREPPNYHCAPVPVLIKDGRLYRAFEDCSPCLWGRGFQALVISAPEEADLLDAANWTMSNKLPFEPEWVPKDWGAVENPGWLEGNVLESPDGSIVNVLRFNSTPLVDRAAITSVSDEGRRLSFESPDGFIEFPGGMTKFTIRFDPQTRRYLTLSNNNTDPAYASQRNLLCLNASGDLRHWERRKTLLEDDSDLTHEESMRLTGFQYVDWHFDGEDLLYLVRTAYDGTHNFHDANRITFHRLNAFRSYL